MAELKTKLTGKSVDAFIDSVKDAARREDCRRIAAIMEKATGVPGRMWGSAIVGFGDYRYQYADGRVGDWFLTGFSPRKNALTIYLMGGIQAHASMLDSLGKHKTGGGCLYINRLDDVDRAALSRLITASVSTLKKKSVRI